nr:MAG TPA: hypothetical protein [Caudoviricetes sp.]
MVEVPSFTAPLWCHHGTVFGTVLVPFSRPQMSSNVLKCPLRLSIKTLVFQRKTLIF